MTIIPDLPRVKVSWPQPNATDNSGKLMLIASTVKPGVELTYSKYTIKHWVKDLSNNTQLYFFNIVIART